MQNRVTWISEVLRRHRFFVAWLQIGLLLGLHEAGKRSLLRFVVLQVSVMGGLSVAIFVVVPPHQDQQRFAEGLPGIRRGGSHNQATQSCVPGSQKLAWLPDRWQGSGDALHLFLKMDSGFVKRMMVPRKG